MPKKAKAVTSLPHIYQVSPEGLVVLKDQLASYEKEYGELRAKLIELRQLKDADEFDLVDDNLRVAHLEQKIKQLQHTIAHCKVSDAKGDGIVQLGSKVRLKNEEGEMECMLVSALEADPSRGRISDQSPLGRALVGKMINALVEVVAPRRKMSYKILKIDS
jgi:transcription elongation factor GreA